VPKPPETEEQLLGRLSKAADQRGARAIERELKARWAHSGSPSADLLLKRTDQAMEAHDFDTARQIAQKLTDISPNFAEAWHRRATLASHKDDYEDALTSLRQTLALQPKNFEALAELGEILEEYNDKPHALDAYRQAKALDPFIDGIADRIRELSKAVEGQGI
jgi:tetratricopeptide (TPR) repeat protein